MIKDHSYGASIPIYSFDLYEVDKVQRGLQERIESLFHDAHGFWWKLVDWSKLEHQDINNKYIYVHWLSETVPWSHVCRFQCPLEDGGML